MNAGASAGIRLPGTPETSDTWELDGGIVIAGDSWGPVDGQLVLLLHGGGQTRHAWKGAGQRLARLGYRAIALDARGHGDSSWSPTGDYSLESIIGDVSDVLRSLGGPRPVLVGASLGGVTSLAAVGDGLVAAEALVLVDVAPRLELEGVQRIASFMDGAANGFGSLEEVADAISRYQPHRRRPDTLDGLAKNVRLGNNDRYRWHWDPRFRSGRPDPELLRRRLEDCARRIDVPALLVRGGSSDVLSQRGAREFLEFCRHAEFIDVAGAGHMVAGDRNDRFAHGIIDFLTRAVPACRPARE